MDEMLIFRIVFFPVQYRLVSILLSSRLIPRSNESIALVPFGKAMVLCIATSQLDNIESGGCK